MGGQIGLNQTICRSCCWGTPVQLKEWRDFMKRFPSQKVRVTGRFPNSDSFFILDRNTFPENQQGRRFLRRTNIFSTFFLFGFQVWEIGAGTTHLSLILVFPSTLANFDLKLATMVMLHPTQWCSILRHVVPSWQISHESWKHWSFPWTAGLPHYGWLSKSQSKKA